MKNLWRLSTLKRFVSCVKNLLYYMFTVLNVLYQWTNLKQMKADFLYYYFHNNTYVDPSNFTKVQDLREAKVKNVITFLILLSFIPSVGGLLIALFAGYYLHWSIGAIAYIVSIHLHINLMESTKTGWFEVNDGTKVYS